MASELRLIVVDPLDGQLERAFARLEELERRWSRFLATSDISRINTAAGVAVRVDDSTLTLVATMVEAWRDTAGAYDPTVLPALVANGYAASRDAAHHRTVLPPGATVDGADPARIALDAVQRTVSIPVGMALDPGGMGKGLAADLVVAELLAGGAAGALCCIGGDLSMAGRPPAPDGWFIAVERPDPADGTLVTLAVSGGGVATSSVRSRRWMHAGTEQHHLIDPRTGRAAQTDLAAVTVIARSGWQAEAHATAALLRGGDGAIALLHGHGLSGIAVHLDGTVSATDDLAGVRALHPMGAVPCTSA
ncbi:MAG: FAD:protein FMN transferase [Acidimicrobiales bacterium]|nr:FAD:protein FMN transferase [Acidimicrobiales bacterium]